MRCLEYHVIRFAGAAVEADEKHALDEATMIQVLADRLHRNRRCGRGGVAVDSGADGWEGNGAQFVFLHKLQAAAIAASQGGFLAIASSAPDGADGVDHPAGGEVVAFRNLGVACFAAIQCPAFSQQTWAAAR